MPLDSLHNISGIGPKTQQKLAKLGINNPIDLVYHFPHRYIDFSKTVSIRQSRANENVTIKGTITDFKNIFTKSHKNIQIATVTDNSGSILLMWFNQPYLSSTLKVGTELSFAGTVSFYQKRLCIFSPEYGQYSTGKIIGVYPETSGLSSKWFRKAIQFHLTTILKEVIDPVPKIILKKYSLIPIHQALIQIHLPDNQEKLDQARLRLSLDEILTIQAISYQKRKQWLSLKPIKPLKKYPQIDTFIEKLPFQLTDSQLRSWQEVESDLTSTNKITNRLLQGDVGSGKTIIAIIAALLNSLNQRQTVIIAPTEILAKQHFKSFATFLKSQKVPVELLSSSTKIDLNKLKPNSVLISTHAVFFQKHHLEKYIGTVIIDEQHRFGVKQRNFLSGFNPPPHCLTMTATPIPRTISLTLLGNLDISTLDTIPQNRPPIKTYLVPQQKIPDCHRWISDHLKKTKSQAFYVCPLIDESENLATIKAASKEYETLKKIYPHLKLALVHGKTPKKDQDVTLKSFKDGKIDILVTTPIIEVGIDIPNATTIIIQSAERFGLAQLHQLRGRVGRGLLQSYCYLFTESDNEKSLSRLKFLEKNYDGMEIAKFDLSTRGPGEVFSTIQHGFPSLRIADISDQKLISTSQNLLKDLINTSGFDLDIIAHQSNKSLSLNN